MSSKPAPEKSLIPKMRAKSPLQDESFPKNCAKMVAQVRPVNKIPKSTSTSGK